MRMPPRASGELLTIAWEAVLARVLPPSRLPHTCFLDSHGETCPVPLLLKKQFEFFLQVAPYTHPLRAQEEERGAPPGTGRGPDLGQEGGGTFGKSAGRTRPGCPAFLSGFLELKCKNDSYNRVET